MKKTYIIYILFILSCFNSFSQSKITPFLNDFESEFSDKRIKSTNESQQLDSMIKSTYTIETEDWLNWKKSEFIYENTGKTVTEYQYNWDNENNVWVKLRRYIYNYDDAGNKIEEIVGLWQQATSDWGQGSKEVWAYNSNGLLTLNAKYHWNSSLEIWEGDERDQYTYDEQGNTLEYIYSEWNETDVAFRNFYQQAYEYTEGNLLKYTFSFWNNTNQIWKTSSFVDYIYSGDLVVLANVYQIINADTIYSHKMDWSYDENNHPILYRSYDFDDINSSWYLSRKDEYLNDIYGNKTMIKIYLLKSEIDSLILTQKSIYTYDEIGNKTFQFYNDYQYTITGGQIVGMDSTGFENTFEFDDSNLLFVELFRSWDDWSDPNKIYKFVYEYDEVGNLKCRSYYGSNESEGWDGIDKYVVDYTDLHNIKQYANYYWDALSGDWIFNNLSTKGVYYYLGEQTFIDSQPQFSKISITLFPNPTEDFLNIEINDNRKLFNLKLYDASGKLMIEKKFQGNQLINVENLNMGIYTCIIESGEYLYVSKIIKI